MAASAVSDYQAIINQLKTDHSDNPHNIQHYKKALQAGRKLLHIQYQSNINAITITHDYAKFIDHILILAWQYDFHTYHKKIALFAIGGYGRGELFPGSDIDLMILTEKKLSQTIQHQIQKFLTFLWDIGLEIGHSVRSVEQTVTECKEDITVITNILEARLLKGSNALYEQMRKATSGKRLWPSKKFFIKKCEEQKARHIRYEDTGYRLEPNVKESPGGLRDIQTIGWIAKRHFETDRINILVKSGYLTESEFDTLRNGHTYLSRIRLGLHLLTGRREDRLLFDHQRILAQQFGFISTDNEAVEHFMQQYYRMVMQLNRLNEMLLQHFNEAVLPAPFWRPERIKYLNRRFQIRYGYLEVINNQIFKRHPQAILETFILLQQHPELKGIRASTIRLIRQYLDCINDDFRHDKRSKAYFMEILRQPYGITRALRRMNCYGVLAAYLPEFENIVGRMQYDLFHAYTVDEHTLFVIRNLRRFTIPRHKHEFPLCNQIMAMLPKPELIYIAGLYHDIGKGRGSDHSRLGAMDASKFCQRHGLDNYDTDLVAWLVSNHLLMSSTSQKRDISSPDIVRQFADQVGDVNRLNYLYLLTVADMCATNPSLWNNWKANLLRELYNACNQIFRHGYGSSELAQQRLQARRNEAREKLQEAGFLPKQIDSLWCRLTDEYFLRHPAADIMWHSSILLNDKHKPPIIKCRADLSRSVTMIFIYARDQANLFAHCASALAQLQLNILDARILETTDSHVIDTFIVHNDYGEPVTREDELQLIADRIRNELQLGIAPARAVICKVPRTHKPFRIKTRVSFEQDETNRYTLLRLYAADRPGVLSQIGQVFQEHKIRLHNARIATFGERIEDVFYITTPDKQLITDKDILKKLEDTIIQALSATAQA